MTSSDIGEIMIEVFTQEGTKHVNQDIYGWQGNTMWVIDGATPLFGDDLLSGNDVQKTMQNISDALKRHVDDKQSLSNVLYHACKDVESEYRHTISGYDFIEKYKLPTFAITIVRVNNMNIEWYGLGDCEIYMHGKVYRDESFDRVNKRNQKEVSDKFALHRETRMLLNDENHPEGYWIGSLDGVGCMHGKQGSLNGEGIENIYLYSDGMATVLQDKSILLSGIDVNDSSFEQYIQKHRHLTTDDITILQIQLKGE